MSKQPAFTSRTLACLLLGWLAMGLAPAWSIAPDFRFGFVGTGGAAFAEKFGLPYYTLEGNYSAERGTVFSSVDANNDPAQGFKVVREVAKLNVRNDGLGESNVQFQAKLVLYAKSLASWYALPSWGRGKKPVFQWYAPDAAALIQAESLQIVETIRREHTRNPQITGTVWEIGNEPNLFPAILPTEYAAIFANYRRVIKTEDPGATVAMGALFVPEISEDLRTRFGEELEAKLKTELQAAGLYNTMVKLGVFPSLVADIKKTVLDRTLNLSSREYLRQVLEAMAERPDLVTLHVYPYDDRAPFLDSTALRNILDTTSAGIADLLASTGIASAWNGGGSIWVTEFGNIESGLDADQASERLRQLIGSFQGNPAFGHWFHYKSTGVDEQFALISSGPAPLTRLAVESEFAPADGGFACDKLNGIGHTYWRASHGGEECLDPVVEPPPQPTDTVAIVPLTVVDSQPPAPVVSSPLPPMIINAAGSLISEALPLEWGWAPDQEVGLEMASVLSRVEFFRDTTASEPWLTADSLKTTFLKPAIPGGPATLWPRVRARDAQNRETPWSAWKMVTWAGAPTTRILSGSAVGFSLRSAPGGRSFVVMRITLPVAASVLVEILDSRGRARKTLFKGRLEAGNHAFPFDGRGTRGRSLPAGIYFCRFQANGEVRTIPSTILP